MHGDCINVDFVSKLDMFVSCKKNQRIEWTSFSFSLRQIVNILTILVQLGTIVAALIQVNVQLTMEVVEGAEVQAAAPAVMKKKNREGTKLIM